METSWSPLIDGLTRAAAERERGAGSDRGPATDREPTDSRQWGDIDAMMGRRRERAGQDRDEARQADDRDHDPEPEHTWADLDKLRQQRMAEPPHHRPPDH